MLVALGLFVLISTLLLWRGFALKAMPGRAASVATGAVSGLFNGAFSTGGPPVILFYFASPAGVIVGRASIIAYFLGTDMIAIPLLAHEGLITSATILRALMFLPALIAGVWVGARSFKGADPAVFRKCVLAILGLLSVVTATKGLYSLYTPGGRCRDLRSPRNAISGGWRPMVAERSGKVSLPGGVTDVSSWRRIFRTAARVGEGQAARVTRGR